MASKDDFKVGHLAISSNAVVTFEAWTKWKRAILYYIEAKAISSDVQKKAILLHRGGPALQDVYASVEIGQVLAEAAAKDKFAFAVHLLDDYFKPTTNKAYERYLFRLIRQGTDSVDQFVVKLRQQAAQCNFHDVSQEIADQIIYATSSDDLRIQILEKRLEALPAIVDLGKLLESVSIQTKQLSEASRSSCIPFVPPLSDSVAKVSSNRGSFQYDPASRPKSCGACGSRRHVKESRDCPAREGTCHKCDKKGHFANRCPDRRHRPADDKSDTKSSGKNASTTALKPKRDDVKRVTSRISDDLSEESEYSDCSFTIRDRHSRLPQQLEQNKVIVTVGGVDVPIYVDSMSSRALFDAPTWQYLRERKVRYRSAEVTRSLFPYGKSLPLSVERAVYVCFSFGKASVWAKAYILAASEGRCEAILGSKVAKKLNILRVGGSKSSRVGDEADVIRRVAEFETSISDEKIGKLRAFQLHIPIDDSVSPVAQPCRRIPFALRKPLKEKTDMLLKDDIIERVQGATPWVSNVVPVIKKSGELRVCVDMRRANQAVLRERFPIPTFDELVSEMRDAEYFSKIDLTAAYHQIELAPESRNITTFVTPEGLFRFKRLFFGVKCAPEIFQRIMEDILRDFKNVKVFFDDIIIFSQNIDDHKLHVKQVLNRLKESGLEINVRKSIFGVKQIEFLGHRLSKNTVEPNENNIEAVRKFAAPTSKKDLQSFLGLINFVAKFIPHFSTLTAPLRTLLKKNCVFRWSDSHQDAFEKLKSTVGKMKAAIFDTSAKVTLLTDASPVGLGAVLLQQSEGKEPEIIAFASHSLTPAERKYSQIEREALGLVWGCEHFRMFLFGRKFTLLTDHKPLEMLFGPKSKPNARLERWVLRLQSYDYEVRHVAGSTNIADPFSRLLQSSPGRNSCSKGVEHTVCHVAEFAVPKKFSLGEIRRASQEDNEILAVLRAIHVSKPPPAPFVRIQYELTECDGILLRGDRIIPPASLRRSILIQAHEGHPGCDVMKRRLRSKVWWPKMDAEVDNYVRKCFSCTLVSKPDPPPPLSRTALPAEAWEFVAIDFLGPLPNGEYILVLIDYFSRFVEIGFTSSPSSSETIRLLWRMFARHGFPVRIKTDNAQAFKSDEFETFLREYGVEHITSPPLWPQANGEVERQNRSLLKRLKIAAAEQKHLETEACKYLLLYNATSHSTTGVAPAQLLFQRVLRDKLPNITHPSIVRDDITDRDAEKKFAGKQLADRRVRAKESEICTGDSVLLRLRPTNKLSPNFDPDPFQVVASNAKEVTLQRGRQQYRRSVADVKLCPPSPLVAENMTVSPTLTPVPVFPTSQQSPKGNERFQSPVSLSPTTESSAHPALINFNLQSSQEFPPLPPIQSVPVSRSGRAIRKPEKLDL